MTEQARLGAAIAKISSIYLVRSIKADDDAATLKWSLRLADYATRLAVLSAPPLAAKEAATLMPPTVSTLTYDQEHEIFIAAQDEILKSLGRPFGHEGAERGALSLYTNIQIAEEHNLPLHVTEFKSFIVPGAAQ
jgi:hypothetical protein